MTLRPWPVCFGCVSCASPCVPDLGPVADCGSLARLDIEARQLASLRWVSGCEQLEVLNLAVGRVDDADPMPLLALPRLRRIGMRKSVAKKLRLAQHFSNRSVEIRELP